MKDRNIVITGGAGMIGSSLVRRLLDEGKQVRVVDNLWRTGNLDNLKENGKLIIPENNFKNLDLSSYENALNAVKDAETVVHLAEIVAGIGFVFDNQSFLFRKNLQINSNVFNACKEQGIKRILYAGSVCSHPKEKQNDPNSPPLKEEEVYPADPESAYGWSKLMGEYELDLIGKENKNIDVSILRFHNVYGPRCSIDSKTSQVIPSLIKKVLESERYLEIWGSGTQTRDFIYVDDITNAITLAMEKGWNKGAIQIGSGKATSIKELGQEIISSSGKNLEMKFDLTKKEGDRGRVADYSRAKNLLGWKPKTSLREGILKTYNWIEKIHYKK